MILLPRHHDMTPDTKINATQESLQTLRSAVALYAGKMGDFPANLDSLVSRSFLKEIPREMINKSDKVMVNPSEGPDFKGGWVYFSDTGIVKVNVDREGFGRLIQRSHMDPYNDW